MKVHHILHSKPLRYLIALLRALGFILVLHPTITYGITGQNRYDSSPYKLQVNVREVVMDFVADNKRGSSLHDLTKDDIRVFEIGKYGDHVPMVVVAFYPVTAAGSDEADPIGGFRVTIGGQCAMHNVFHYEIAFDPGMAGWTSGYHHILIKSTRKHVALYYRHWYYVGQTKPLKHRPSKRTIASILRQASCYHPATPPTISLTSRHLVTANNYARASVAIDADSLAFTSLSKQSTEVHLDYGICTFDSSGHPLRFMSAFIKRRLSAAEYQQARQQGLPNMLEFPVAGNTAMARIAVRDSITGNLGVTIIQLQHNFEALTPDEQKAAKLWMKQLHMAKLHHIPINSAAYPPLGPIGSFGSVAPISNSFCGDVYTLPAGTSHLPLFWDLDSIGAIYTRTLNVPHQQFWNTGGLPGVTRRTAWFGIDYYAKFWVRNPGEYKFDLFADDGADLYIDGRLVINRDGLSMGKSKEGDIYLSRGQHTIHLPYFQGPLNAVGLILAVKPPQRSWQVFNMNSFATP